MIFCQLVVVILPSLVSSEQDSSDNTCHQSLEKVIWSTKKRFDGLDHVYSTIIPVGLDGSLTSCQQAFLCCGVKYRPLTGTFILGISIGLSISIPRLFLTSRIKYSCRVLATAGWPFPSESNVSNQVLHERLMEQ